MTELRFPPADRIHQAMISFVRTLYVRFDERILSVTDFKTGSESRVTPVLALERRGDGQHVVAIGEEALGRRDCELVYPFSHERLVLAHVDVAEALLRYQIVEAVRGWILFRPRVILHPLRRFSTELVDVERRALLDLGLSLGASWAAVHVGAELSAETYAQTAFPWSAEPGRR